MNTYKLTFQLKQHTPMIHFQWDQHGATLRATELKPKLDRFLIEKLEQDEIFLTKTNKKGEVKQNPDYDSWFIGKEHLALNYRIRLSQGEVKYFLPFPIKLNSNSYPDKEKNLKEFIVQSSGIRCEILGPTAYFANADKISFHYRSDVVDVEKTQVAEMRFAVFSEDLVENSISSSNRKLLESLEKHLASFFLTHNFGSRQNKGFGSFTVTKINQYTVKTDINSSDFFAHSKRRSDSISDVMKFINSEYQLLKGGTNFPQYRKPQLFDYYVNQGIRWEKRFFKQKINQNKIDDYNLYFTKHRPVDFEEENNEYKYIRSFLGLADHFEFQVFKKDRKSRKDLAGSDGSKKYQVTLKHLPNREKKEEKIDRLQSPIFFKVIDGIVYMKISSIYTLIQDKEFEVKLDLKGERGTRSLGTIRTPKTFDLSAFLKKSLNEHNWKLNH